MHSLEGTQARSGDTTDEAALACELGESSQITRKSQTHVSRNRRADIATIRSLGPIDPSKTRPPRAKLSRFAPDYSVDENGPPIQNSVGYII